MKLKTIYLVLCVLGLALPYWQFVPWLATNGLNAPLFFQQLFANRIGAFFGMDVVVSAVTLVAFARNESSRLGMPAGRWLPLIAVLAVGVSLGLPLFLYMRERKLEQDRTQARTSPA
jgi:Terpene cyclase DEP1